MVSLKYYHTGGWIVVFNLHFLHGDWSQAHFHLFTGYSDLLFCELSVHIFCPFFSPELLPFLIDLWKLFIYFAHEFFVGYHPRSLSICPGSLTQRRQWHPTPVLLPGKSHGWRSPVGCSSWGLEESDMTKRLHFHFSLSGIGEGNGSLLQYSCLENPRDGGAWWTAIYGLTQSWTRLKWLSSSSSSSSLTSSDVLLLIKCPWLGQ